MIRYYELYVSFTVYLQAHDDSGKWKNYIDAVEGAEKVYRAFNAWKSRGVHIDYEAMNHLSLLIHRPLNVRIPRTILPGKENLYLKTFLVLYNRCVRDWKISCNEDDCVSHKIFAVAGRTVRSVIKGEHYEPYLSYWYLCTCKHPTERLIDFFAKHYEGTELEYTQGGLVRMATVHANWGHSSNRVFWHQVENLKEACYTNRRSYMRLLKTFLSFVAAQYYDKPDKIAFKPDYISPILSLETEDSDIPGFVVDFVPNQPPTLLDITIQNVVSC